MSRGVCVAFVAVMVAAGCGSSWSGSTAKSVQEALAILAPLRGGAFDLFPREPGSIACKIPAGGVVFHFVQGVCETRVRAGRDGGTVVRFVESWGRGAASHTWEFWVSRRGVVTRSRQYGQVPPQNAV